MKKQIFEISSTQFPDLREALVLVVLPIKGKMPSLLMHQPIAETETMAEKVAFSALYLSNP